MKTVLFITTLLLLSLTSFSQFNTVGQKIINGSFSTSFVSYDNAGPNQSSFNPSLQLGFGKFSKPNHLRLININLAHNFTTGSGTYNTKSTQASVGYSFSKIYPLKQNFYFAIAHGPSVFGTYSRSQFSPNSNGTKTRYIELGIRYSVEPKLYYQFSKRLVASASVYDLLNAQFSVHKEKQYFNTGAVSEYKGVNGNFGFGLSSTPLSNVLLGFSYLLKK